MSGLGTPQSALAACKHSPRRPHTHFLGTLLAQGHLSYWRRACSTEPLRPRGLSPCPACGWGTLGCKWLLCGWAEHGAGQGSPLPAAISLPGQGGCSVVL